MLTLGRTNRANQNERWGSNRTLPRVWYDQANQERQTRADTGALVRGRTNNKPVEMLDEKCRSATPWWNNQQEACEDAGPAGYRSVTQGERKEEKKGESNGGNSIVDIVEKRSGDPALAWRVSLVALQARVTFTGLVSLEAPTEAFGSRVG